MVSESHFFVWPLALFPLPAHSVVIVDLFHNANDLRVLQVGGATTP